VGEEGKQAMKLDRNQNDDGKGKYALVRLRKIEEGSEAAALLIRLAELGHVDWGTVGSQDEFFVVKLRDRYAAAAIKGYSDAASDDARTEPDEARSRDKFQWAIQVQGLGDRAGILSEHCKDPD
jgi:hypothetical protein